MPDPRLNLDERHHVRLPPAKCRKRLRRQYAQLLPSLPMDYVVVEAFDVRLPHRFRHTINLV